MALACALIFDKAANWEIIPRALRHQHAAEAWISAGRLVLRKDPHTARDYFARARRHRLTPRVLAYGAAAFGLSLFRCSPALSTVTPGRTGSRPPTAPHG